MSKFAARMVAGLSAMYDLLGDESVYVDGDDSSTECVVIVDHEVQEYGDTQAITAGTVVLRVRRTEIADRPRRGDVFTMVEGGAEYSVVQVLAASDEFEHRVLAK